MERNEQTTLRWARGAIKELRVEMRELSQTLNSSALLQQLQDIRNEASTTTIRTIKAGLFHLNLTSKADPESMG